MSRETTVECPHCGGPARVGTDNPYRPFCSRRCKLIDLGDWLDESNRIPDRGGPGGASAWGESNGGDGGGLPH